MSKQTISIDFFRTKICAMRPLHLEWIGFTLCVFAWLMRAPMTASTEAVSTLFITQVLTGSIALITAALALLSSLILTHCLSALAPNALKKSVGIPRQTSMAYASPLIVFAVRPATENINNMQLC